MAENAARTMFIAGPAAATRTISRRGWLSRAKATGTGLAQPNRNGAFMNSNSARHQNGADRIHMFQRVQGHPPASVSGVVTQRPGGIGVSRLVKRDCDQDGQCPQRRR